MSIEKHVPKFPVIKVEFSNRLRDLREAKGYKITEFARLIGVDRKAYSKWENPKEATAYPKNYNVLASMCEVLSTNIHYLLTGLNHQSQENAPSDKNFIALQNRYRDDPEFHYAVTVLLYTDKKIVKTLTDLMDQVNESYRGKHPIFEN